MTPESKQGARPDASGPIGQGEYEVQPGDCLLSIAQRSGHFWETLWNHPQNAELRSVRRNPGVLLPDDRVTIPPRRTGEAACQTGKRHSFVRRGMPAKLCVRLLHEDDSPIAHEPYILDVDGNLQRGELNREGRLEVAIPPDARRAVIKLVRTNQTFELLLGEVEPIDSWSGIQTRLRNLGFLEGEESGQPGELTRRALADFQEHYKLPTSGEPDAATKAKLLEVHNS